MSSFGCFSHADGKEIDATTDEIRKEIIKTLDKLAARPSRTAS